MCMRPTTENSNFQFSVGACDKRHAKVAAYIPQLLYKRNYEYNPKITIYTYKHSIV